MKATGITRRIDELGRIVVPKEIRKNMHIKDGDLLEIFTENDFVLMRKYSPIGEMKDNAKLYAESVSSQIPYTVCICDQDYVIVSAGPNAKKLYGKTLHENAQNLLLERRNALINCEKDDFSLIDEYDCSKTFRFMCLSTIIVEGDAVGLVCLLSENKELTDQELLITKIGAEFLGKQLMI